MSSPAPRTVLVTGSMGFLGRHLVRRLLEDGHTVIGLDKDIDEQEVQSLEKDYPGRSHFAQGNLLMAFNYFGSKEPALNPPSLGKFYCDDGEDRTIFQIFEDFKPAWIAHLAAMAREPASRQFPSLSYELNQRCALELMVEACKYWEILEGQPREDFRAYFQSTDKVYRFEEIEGLATEASPYVRKLLGHASQYAKDKATVEQVLTVPSGYFTLHGFPFLIGNLVNVIGPGDLNKERLIQGAVDTWLRGDGPYERLIADNKDHKRQYIPVLDACNAIVTILEHGEPQNKYNISNGVTLSNEQAIQLVQEAFQELIREGKIPTVKTEYLATDDKDFRPGADEE